jgi:hypothetical protein
MLKFAFHFYPLDYFDKKSADMAFLMCLNFIGQHEKFIISLKKKLKLEENVT